jgi:hypothetical protein
LSEGLPRLRAMATTLQLTIDTHDPALLVAF